MLNCVEAMLIPTYLPTYQIKKNQFDSFERRGRAPSMMTVEHSAILHDSYLALKLVSR